MSLGEVDRFMPIRNDKQSVEIDAEEAISVTVDASDLTVASAEPIRNIVRRFGRPVSARAFADFQQPALAELAVQLYQLGFTLVHCPSWPNGDGYPKSIVSDVMAQDLRDQLEQLNGVETYLLVATSRDYIAVTNAIKRHEARVVVVAEDAKVCRELKVCADEFVTLPPTRQEPSRYGRLERLSESVASERLVENTRPERSSTSSRGKRASEAARAERASETAKTEPETPRLPSDAEVLNEVKRIVAAEGICTPRRLARALCPVDRTPTGELRSRIANRIQALIDSGKLQRERLVVGGTSVETILVREDRNGRDAHVGMQAPATASTSVLPPPGVPGEPEGAGNTDPVSGEMPAQVDQVSESPADPVVEEPEKAPASPAKDLDAFVESVLRSPEFGSGATGAESEPEPVASEEGTPAEPAPAEKPKRSRPRRRTSKTAAPEANGTT